MKKKILMAVVALFVSTLIFAQVSTTPEVPRNYKPEPKELIPMPDSLTTEKIFPVLGKYDVLDKDGDSTVVYITLDPESKGVVWVSGLAQGKFKADLKASPAVYRIPSQKTLANDPAPNEMMSEEVATTDADATGKEKSGKKYSGKSVNEGTLIYDNEANALYINLGTKFNEDDPKAVFPELMVSNETTTETVDGTTAAKKPKTPKGINYTGAKVLETSASISE